MIKFVLKKTAVVFITIFFVSLFVFSLICAIPGNSVETNAAKNFSKERIEAQKEYLGLNKPVHERYINWLKNLLKGNFGYSFSYKKSVLSVLKSRTPITVYVGIFAMLLQFLIAVPIGIFAANNKKISRFADGISFLSMSLPMFFVALLLKNILSVKLNLLPPDGFQTVGFEGDGLFLFWDRLRHLILPSLVLCFADIGGIIRYVKFFMNDVLDSDFIAFARLKGISEKRILFRHGLKNMILPFINVVAINLPNLFVGSYIVEEIFSLNGLGKAVMEAFFTRDYNFIMAYTIILSLLILICNASADIISKIADKRVNFVK